MLFFFFSFFFLSFISRGEEGDGSLCVCVMGEFELLLGGVVVVVVGDVSRYSNFHRKLERKLHAYL